jgi:hypothetical protein
MSALCHLSARPTYKRRLFIKALVIMAVTRLAMAFLDLPRLHAFLVWLADRAAAPQAHDDYAHRVAAAVTSAGVLVPGADALTRAFATLTLMRCRGLLGNLQLVSHPHSSDHLSTEARVIYKGVVVIGDHS